MTACYLGHPVGRRGTKQITSASIDVMNGGLQRLSEAASPDKRNAFLLKDALDCLLDSL